LLQRIRFWNRLPWRARLACLGGACLLALIALIVLIADAFFLEAPAPAATIPRTIPFTDVNPYGANFFLEREVEAWKRDKTVRMASEAGIGWAKQEFLWEEIETRKGVFDWSKYDDIVAVYQKYNLQIIARLDRPPAWARQHPSETGSSGPPDRLDDYADFVEEFARHYRGRIFFFQVWNEPNLGREWDDGPVDPDAYVQLLQLVYPRVKAVDARIQILSAPLAITLGEPFMPGSDKWRNMNDLDFLEAMYRAGAKDYFDILSANAFGLESPPEAPPDPRQLNFQRLVLERQVMERNGDESKPVWIAEYGWNAAPESFPKEKLTWGRVTEQEQADYTLRGIEYARANWPWVGVVNLWYFRQVGNIVSDNAEYYFRLVDVDFTPRLVLSRVQEATRKYAVAGPGEYQETDPAITWRGRWELRQSARARGTLEMVSHTPGAQAIIRFWGDSLDLVSVRGPDSGRVYVSLKGEAPPNLPRDSAGHAYLDLASEGPRVYGRVPVLTDLGRGAHTVELTVASQEGEVVLDGFTVQAANVPNFPTREVAIAAVLGLLAAVGLWIEWKRRENK
jgi:hypothetical protein